MPRIMFLGLSHKWAFLFAFIFSYAFFLSAEENFILINGHTNEVISEIGPHLHQQFSPCSTFKITLSLMGYDAGILVDEHNPVLEFQDGYDEFLPEWKEPVSPLLWMQHSCFWFSKILSIELGLTSIENYLMAFEYGNQDASDGLAQPGPTNPFWVVSSLKISPMEQTRFLQKLVLGKLPVSSEAVQQTKKLLFKEDLSNGWRLFGKTGWSGSDIAKNANGLEFSWFVGWIENDNQFFPFAYLIRSKKIMLEKRIPRVKQLIQQAL